MNIFPFDILRLVLAYLVVASHIIGLSDTEVDLPFRHLYDAELAVYTFFAVSGFFIVKSYSSSRSILHFLSKRFMRIYPAYIVIIIAPVIFGFIVQTEDMFSRDCFESVGRYFIANAFTLNFIAPQFCGLFENSATNAVNGSLWTIKNEVLFYLIVPIIIFLKRNLGSLSVFIGLTSLAYLYSYLVFIVFPDQLAIFLQRQFPSLLAYFSIGIFMASSATGEKILNKILGLFFLLVLHYFFDAKNLNQLITVYLFFWLFLIIIDKIEIVRPPAYVDISYSLYLVHFPVIQFYLILTDNAENTFTTPIVEILGLIFVFAIILSRYVELPIMERYKNDRTKRR